MKKPVPSQISTATPAITPMPAPAFFMSGWKPPLPPGGWPLPPFLPRNSPASLRLRSPHSSSRSGGLPWPWPCGRRSRPFAGGIGRSPSGRGPCPEPSESLSSPRPQRGSFRLNIPRRRLGSSAQRDARCEKFMRKVSSILQKDRDPFGILPKQGLAPHKSAGLSGILSAPFAARTLSVSDWRNAGRPSPARALTNSRGTG